MAVSENNLKYKNMLEIGTPFTKSAKRALLCGSGELGKEVAIELQRYGVEVIAVDRYANAPAMQIAQRCHVINMLDGQALRSVIESEKPDLIIFGCKNYYPTSKNWKKLEKNIYVFFYCTFAWLLSSPLQFPHGHLRVVFGMII